MQVEQLHAAVLAHLGPLGRALVHVGLLIRHAQHRAAKAAEVVPKLGDRTEHDLVRMTG